jgi:hypothetical protein
VRTDEDASGPSDVPKLLDLKPLVPKVARHQPVRKTRQKGSILSRDERSVLLVRDSSAAAPGTKLWGTPIGDQIEISNRERRWIIHGREHHAFANGIKLQIQAADVAAVEPPRLRGELMTVNVDPAGGALPSRPSYTVQSAWFKPVNVKAQCGSHPRYGASTPSRGQARCALASFSFETWRRAGQISSESGSS